MDAKSTTCMRESGPRSCAMTSITGRQTTGSGKETIRAFSTPLTLPKKAMAEGVAGENVDIARDDDSDDESMELD